MFEKIPPDIRTFFNKHIKSVSHLETLLIVKNSKIPITAEKLSEITRTNVSFASLMLKELVGHGLIVSNRDNQFEWIDHPKISDVVTEIESLYSTHRSILIAYIYSQPLENIRNFADAFKIKKDS